MGQLAGAVTREGLAAASREMAEQVICLLQQNILQLETQIRELKREQAAIEVELRTFRERLHAENAQAQVLAERLEAADARAEMLGRFDWLLTIFIALGGGIAGLGISWPDLPTHLRVVLASIGFALILLPALFKLTGRGKRSL